MRLGFLDPTGAGLGLGDDGETGPLEQLSGGGAEGAVVVDDENTILHRLIVPARAPINGVTSRLFFAAAAASVAAS